jgi:hypothetical protein
MDVFSVLTLAVAVGLAALTFRLAVGEFGWHWAVGLLLAVIPVAATFFFGIIGLLGAALFVEVLYKALAG